MNNPRKKPIEIGFNNYGIIKSDNLQNGFHLSQERKLATTGRMVLNTIQLGQKQGIGIDRQTHIIGHFYRQQPRQNQLLAADNQLKNQIIEGKAIEIKAIKQLIPQQKKECSSKIKPLQSLEYLSKEKNPTSIEQNYSKQNSFFNQKIPCQSLFQKNTSEIFFSESKGDDVPLTLDLYFNNNNNKAKNILANPNDQIDLSLKEESFQETDSQVGFVYYGENDDAFFGFPSKDELDIEKSLYELRQQIPQLSFNLKECDLDDLRSSCKYEEFVIESIKYVASKVSKNTEEQHNYLMYFVFNAVEDSFFSSQMSADILVQLLPHINEYPEILICILAKRIENKFYMISDEDLYKLQKGFEIIITYFGSATSFSHSALASSIRQMMKMLMLRTFYLSYLLTQRKKGVLPQNPIVIEHLLVLKVYKMPLGKELEQVLDNLETHFEELLEVKKLKKRLKENN